MGKRKSKTTEFKAPKRMQHRIKHTEDENQTLTPQSENNNSQKALCSENPDELQHGESALQEFPVEPCSLEEKTSHDDNNELANPPEVSHEIEQAAAITPQTPEPDHSDKHTLSRPLNTETTDEDQPKVDDEESENTRNSNHQIPDDSDSELPSDEENTATEPQMDEQFGSSETSCDLMPEDTGSVDPLVKRKIRKRMGMCRFGERNKMLKGQTTAGNVFEERQENEMVTNEDPVMTSDEKGVIESEVSVASVSTSCLMEDTPVHEEQEQSDVQYGNELQVKCMARESVTCEADHTIPSHLDAEDLNPPEQYKQQNTTESTIREDSSEVSDEISVDLVEVCKESTDVSAQEEVVFAGSLEVPNEASRPAIEVADPSGEELVVENNEIDASPSDDPSEQCVELMDITASKNKSPLTEVSTTFTTESKTDCESNSVSLPAAPPGGDDEDVQSFTEHVSSVSDAHEPHRSPVAELDPSSPLSMHSLTDSQLNNIPLSLEDLPISEASFDLEDASELVCDLIRDIASLNQVLMDARRKIGQQGRKPPLRTQKYRHNFNRF